MVQAITEEQALRRGDSYARSEKLYYTDENGDEQPIDIATAFDDIKFQLRLGGRETPLIIGKSLKEGTITVQDGNTIVWEFTEEERNKLKGKYRYELEMTYKDGSVETWIIGTLTANNDTAS